MRKEEELIRILALGLVDQEWPGKVTAILRERLDWEHIISSAGLEGVGGFIYDRLKKNQLDQFVPQEILIRFESIYYTYSAQNALFYEELSRVVARLEQGKIPVIMLKGVFLASAIYENIAIRPMRDLDLLVKKEDVLNAVEILEQFGYQPIAPVKEQLKNPLNYSLTLAKLNVGIDNSLTIDLHWHILNASWLMGLSSGKCEMAHIWANAGTAVIAGIRTRVLSAEHLLISLAVNGFTHCYERLILLVDFARVLEKYKERIDLPRVYQEAGTYYIENILEHTLELASEIPLSEARSQGVFKRKYHYSRPVMMYVLTKKGLIGKGKAFFRIALVITRFLFKRLEHKNA